MSPTKTKTPPSVPELREQLRASQQEAEQAEQTIGAAALDGSSTADARKRLEQAQDTMSTTEAAIAEVERRSTASDANASKLATAEEQALGYRWTAEHFQRAIRVIETHEAARQAFADFEAMPPIGTRRAREQLRRRRNPLPNTPRLLDEEIVCSVVNKWQDGYAEGLDPDHLLEMQKRAEELADQADAEAEELKKAS